MTNRLPRLAQLIIPFPNASILATQHKRGSQGYTANRGRTTLLLRQDPEDETVPSTLQIASFQEQQ
ncbi:MAG TPA: hypothetical protein VH744_04680 [Terriglobales bacterium]|jgi:hypothetical protein